MSKEIEEQMARIAELLKKFPESVQPQAFEILSAHLARPEAATPRESVSAPAAKKVAPGEIVRGAAKKPRHNDERIGLRKELDLRAQGNVPSFRAFCTTKGPTSNISFNTVAVYYLKELRGLQGITAEHLNTCYREVGRRPPQTASAFRQSLWDASSSRYGYLDCSDMSDIKIPQRGVIFVEHDLPVAASKTAVASEASVSSKGTESRRASGKE